MQMLQQRIGHAERVMFSLADFLHPPLDLSKSCVLFGASEIGKTRFALAHFQYPLLVKNIEDLKKISLRTDGLVFDDMRFTHPDDLRKLNLSPEQTIALLDIELACSIGARYSDIFIPAGMRRIFTTNRRLPIEAIFPAGVNPDQQRGIDRRQHIYGPLQQDLRRNPHPPPAARGGRGGRGAGRARGRGGRGWR